jgi:hypothetical protein
LKRLRSEKIERVNDEVAVPPLRRAARRFIFVLAFSCSLSFSAGFSYFAFASDTASANKAPPPASGGGTPASGAVSDNRDLPARSVHIELNKVDNNHGYDVEIRGVNQKWVKPYMFHIDDEHLRVRLTPGPYKIHTRSYLQDGYPGRWSRWSQFWIQFKAPDVAFPAPGQKIKPMGDKTEKITFEWKAVPTAKQYSFKLKDKDGNVIKHTMTPNTWFVTEVGVNSKYSWQVTPLVDRRLEDPTQKFPFNEFEVLPPGEGMRTMKFEVGGNAKAIKYQFEFVRLADDNEESAPSMFDAREPNFKVRLRPGRYEVRVRSVDKDSVPSDWSTPQKFFIDFFPPIVIGPIKGEVVDSNDDDDADVELKWKPVPDVNHYKVFVFDEKGEMIKSLPVETNKAKVKLHHNRKYMWKVVGYSAEEPDRRPASVNDKDVNTFTMGKYERLDLNPAEESSAWYGWLREISSQTEFDGKNYDNNTLITQNVQANAIDGATGLWIRKTNWGFLANGTLSAYRTDSQIFSFGNVGANIGYRYIYNEENRLRLWAGYYYRELPEIQANPYQITYNITKLKDSGPQFQASFAHAINDRWGWHAFSTFYYSMKDQGTPNSLPSIPTLSTQLGIAATYKFNNYYTGMIGYAFKKEHAEYNSADRSGNQNVIDFTGHYLNLILEFGLSKPHPPGND